MVYLQPTDYAPNSGQLLSVDGKYVAARDYDVIVIGSGAGGGTLLHSLANDPALADKRIALLERGPFLPHEAGNEDIKAIRSRGRYQAAEKWRSGRRLFQPAVNYAVGGNTKYYAACLFRFRESDFEDRQYVDGLSPAWPIGYGDLKEYYQRAEELYEVRGNRGEDQTEPPEDRPYPYQALAHEPILETTHQRMAQGGWDPFHLPLGVRTNDDPSRFDANAPCVRCAHCGGHPCRYDGKSDAEVLCVRPAMAHPNVSVLPDHRADHFITNDAGTKVEGVAVETAWGPMLFRAKQYVLAAGAANSAAIMLRSPSHRGNHTLANANGLVGANYMFHLHSMVMLVEGDLPETRYPKTLGFNRFYEANASTQREEIAGTIQNVGAMHADTLSSYMDAFVPSALAPKKLLNKIGANNLSFIVSTEDLPLKENRITLGTERGRERIKLKYKRTNVDAHRRLAGTFRRDLKHALADLQPQDDNHFGFGYGFASDFLIPESGNAHQVGTLGMGRDAQTSVVDSDCRVWGLDNLYVADGSVFTTSAAVNPSLTIMANALRVAEKVADRL